MSEADLLIGARNCVLDCAKVGKGSHVAVINEIGAVEEPVVTAIEQVARQAGARVDVVWAPPFAKDQPGAEIPADVFRAFRDAEIVINHYHSLSREILQEHFPDETRVRVPNRAVTAALLASPWARFPYSLQRTISDAFEARMTPGRHWRITSPAGTDVRGCFAEAGSAVASAFFQIDEDNNRARRNFPGGVHPPHVSTGVEGTLVAEYLDGAHFGARELLYLQISGSCISSIEGGDPSGKASEQIAKSDGYLDSWHAGVNPRTIVPIARETNPRKWFSYSHCSPQVLHFHLGRTYDTINVAVFNQTLEIGGVALIRDGVLNITEGLGLTEDLTRNYGAIESLQPNLIAV